MRVVSRRAQVVLPDAEYALLEKCAAERGVTISGLVREVLQHTLFRAARAREQERALDRLFAQALPVAEWADIEQELEAMWAGHEGN